MESSNSPDQVLDVAAIEGGDEAAPHAQQHVAGDRIGPVFMRDDAAAGIGDTGAAFQQVAQGDGAFDQSTCVIVEKDRRISLRAASKPGKSAAPDTPFWRTACYGPPGGVKRVLASIKIPVNSND
jgi:hypothetical protein